MQQLSASDLQRRTGMRRMKRLALGLLVFVTVVFVVARAQEDQYGWVGYVRAFAEAAMVGALADWFAVTALFRHPLGIPIPHTAIIPNRKDQIGESLGEFVQENFLTKEVLDERLDHAHVGRRLGAWLGEPANAARAGRGAADALARRPRSDRRRDVAARSRGMIERKVRDTPGGAADRPGHRPRRWRAATTSGCSTPRSPASAGSSTTTASTFRQRLATESPWWVPEPIDDRIFEKIYAAVHRFLADVGADPDARGAARSTSGFAAFAERLQHRPGLHGARARS